MAQFIQPHGPGLLAKSKSCRTGELFIFYNTETQKKEMYVFTSDGTDTSPASYVRIGAEGIIFYRDEIETLPVKPEANGVYKVTKKIEKTNTTPQFLPNDTILWTGSKWIMLAGAGSFDNTKTVFENHNIETVQDALVFLSRHPVKAERHQFYGDTNSAVEALQKKVQSEGACFFVCCPRKSDPYIEFNSSWPEKLKRLTEAGDLTKVYEMLVLGVNPKGSDNFADVVLYVLNIKKHAEDLKLYKSLAHSPRGSLDATEDYKNSPYNETLEQLFQNIFKTKADLDSNGKVYLSQLPDTILGSMEYKGTLTISPGTTKDSPAENIIPKTSATNTATGEEKTHKGDYWVASGEGWIKVGTEVLHVDISDFIVVDEAEEDGTAKKISVISRKGKFKGIKVNNTNLIADFVELKESSRIQLTENETEGSVEIDVTSSIPEINSSSEDEGHIPYIAYSQEKDKKKKTRKVLLKSAFKETSTNVTLEQKDFTLEKEQRKNSTIIQSYLSLTSPTAEEIITDNNIPENNQTHEIYRSIKLPSRDGTLALKEDTVSSKDIEARDSFIPAVKEANGKKTLINSPMVVKDENTVGVSKIIFTSGVSTPIPECSIQAGQNNGQGINFLLDYRDVDASKNRLNLLHEDSVIDGGYWV